MSDNKNAASVSEDILENFEPTKEVHNKTILEYYDSVEEWTRTIDKRWADTENMGSSHKEGWDFSSAEDRGSWCPLSYEEIKNLCLYGDEKTGKKLAEKTSAFNKLFGWEQKHRKPEKAVAGYRPVVPRAIISHPKSMVAREKGIEKGKIINILFDVCASCSVSEKEYFEKISKVLAIVAGLESKGYRVKLDILTSYSREYNVKGVCYASRIKIKSPGQRLNFKRLAPIMTNICVLRRISFRWYESLPESVYISGYGVPLGRCSNKNAWLKEYLPSDAYYVDYYSDLEHIFEEQLDMKKLDKEEGFR